MQIIQLDEPVTIREQGAVKITVAPLMFSTFVRISEKALLLQSSKRPLNVLLQRLRMQTQVTFHTVNDQTFKLSDEDLATLPAAVARKIVPLLALDEGGPGELLSDGDGLSAPVHVKLGTPIKAGGDKEFAELEFLAKTYSDIENILVADQPIFQTFALIEGLANPIDGSIERLPSWAIDQITIADGVFILNNVLPRFLG